MRKIGLTALAAVLFWAGAPVPSRADLSDFFSRWRLAVTLQEEYSSNVFLASDETIKFISDGKVKYRPAGEKVSDFITTLSPQFSFSTLPKSGQAGAFDPLAAARETPYGAILDFKPGLVYYGRGTSSNYVSLDGNLNAWYSFGRVLTFRVREYILRSQEPREQESAYNALPGQYVPGADRGRATYLRNIVEPAVDFRFGGPDDLITLAYQSNIYRTDQENGDNSRTDSLLPRFTWWIDRRNGISIGGQYQVNRYENSPDLTGYQVTGRYTWRLNPHTSFYGENTFALRNYSPSTPLKEPKPPVWPPREIKTRSTDYTLETPSVGVEHAFTPTLSGGLQVGGYFQNPDQGSNNSGFTYNATLTNRSEQLTLGLLVQGGYNEDFSSSENLGFTKSHRVVGNVGYNFTSRISAGLSPSFEYSKSSDNLKQNRWELSLNSSYKILKWLDLSASATYRDNRANDSIYDYNEFRALLKLTATF